MSSPATTAQLNFHSKLGQSYDKPVVVREVYSSNLEYEFHLIRQFVDHYPYCAMDTEFPGVVARPVGTFKTQGQYAYAGLRINVDMMKLIQLGITLSDCEGNLPTLAEYDEYYIWQFNFREFSPSHDIHSTESIELLRESGINFDVNEEQGIDVQHFAELLMVSGIVLNEDIRWITFHSSYDFGYLLKLVTNSNLPEDDAQFFELLNMYFPQIYDIKYLMRFCENLPNKKGGLNKLAEFLEVPRIGQEHQAGSDSLLTSATFFRMKDVFFDSGQNSKIYSADVGGSGLKEAMLGAGGHHSISLHGLNDSKFMENLLQYEGVLYGLNSDNEMMLNSKNSINNNFGGFVPLSNAGDAESSDHVIKSSSLQEEIS